MISFHKFKNNRRRKKRFIRNHVPKLIIKRFNPIRLSGGVYGAIWLRYRREGKNRGYVDIRDFVTDIANHGLKVIKFDQPGNDYQLDYNTFLRARNSQGRRVCIANVDLNAAPLKDVCLICRSVSDVDTYDTMSILIFLGWLHKSGGWSYSRDEMHEKIYS